MSEYQTNSGQNPYFDVSGPDYQNDKDLISVIINEYYNKYGVCMEYYITSYDTDYDKVFGEDNDRSYERKFEVNGYFSLPREDKLWTKFGMEQSTDITLWISKRHFQGTSVDPESMESYVRPRIGDIIKSDYSNFFYEITEVAEDTGMYLQSTQHVWELQMRPMKDEYISISDKIKDSAIAKVTNIDDILDIKDDVDVEKENIVYKPKKGEKPNKDPFGNW